MKLATIRSDGRERVALVHSNDSKGFLLGSAAKQSGRAEDAFRSMLSLIDDGDRSLDEARRLFDAYGKEPDLSVDISRTEVLAPVPEPRQMRDGMSFPLHIVQSPRGQLKLKARISGDLKELERLNAEPLPELPEIYR